MIQVHKLNFGDYNQKIILNGRKIIDTECDCTWGKNNQKAWKEGNTLCRHIKSAIMHLDLRIKKYGKS